MKKALGLLVVTLLYIVAIVLGIVIYQVLPISDETNDNILIKLLICDGVMFLIIYLASIIIKNPKVYEPFWNVLPMFMSLFVYIKYSAHNVFGLILVIIVALWGLRILFNFGYRFVDLKTMNAKTIYLKERHPKLFPLINLFGLQLLPSFIVFIAMIPVLSFIMGVGSEIEPTVVTILGFIFAVVALVVETIADMQMNNFKVLGFNNSRILDTGLWKNSRHPNYFGECFFWFSLFLIYFSYDGANIILVFSPGMVFFLFETLIIPMMDKYLLKRYQGYKEYKKVTNAMLPMLPPVPKNTK